MPRAPDRLGPAIGEGVEKGKMIQMQDRELHEKINKGLLWRQAGSETKSRQGHTEFKTQREIQNRSRREHRRYAKFKIRNK